MEIPDLINSGLLSIELKVKFDMLQDDVRTLHKALLEDDPHSAGMRLSYIAQALGISFNDSVGITFNTVSRMKFINQIAEARNKIEV